MIGIYQIQSIIKPNRIYIGSTVNFDSRKNTHIQLLRNNKSNSKLQNHFNKYGESDLQFSIIETCSKDQLLIREQHYINLLNPWFNIRKVADRNNGIKASVITKQKLSESIKKAWVKRKEDNPFCQFTEESKKKISSSLRKYWNELSYDQKNELTKGMRNTKISDETRKKLSIASIRRGAKPPSMKGKKFTEEHKKKISQALKGKIVSFETRLKYSKMNKGRVSPFKGKKHSAETGEKISQALKGKYIGALNNNYGKCTSDETKNKIRESLLKYYAQRKTA